MAQAQVKLTLPDTLYTNRSVSITDMMLLILNCTLRLVEAKEILTPFSKQIDASSMKASPSFQSKQAEPGCRQLMVHVGLTLSFDSASTLLSNVSFSV